MIMVEFITKITNVSYDQYLALTEAKDYNDIQVNVEHIPDTPIGKIKEIFTEKDDKTNIYAKLEINDNIYSKIKDEISGCSVELVNINTKNGISIPTACSILLGSEPAVEDAGKTILERVYSKVKDIIVKNDNMVNKEVEENQIILINKYTNKKIVYLLEYDNKRDYYNSINELLADYIKDKIIDEFVK